MFWLRSLLFRFQSFFNKRRFDEELDEELRFCLDMETESNIQMGKSPEEARRAARLKIGGQEQIKEICRDERGFPLLESVDPDQPIYRVETMEDYLRFSISKNRLSNLLMSFFGLSALTLACLGLYGVLAFRVAQRTHEIGIRRALGAGRGHIFGMVVGRGILLVTVGLALGSLAAFGLTRFLSSMLFGVGAMDEATFIIACTVFLFVGFAACALPAIRAVRVDPASALRHE